MKKIYIPLFLCLYIVLPSFSQGICFEDLTFQKALDKAVEEGKLVFVDSYTKWCGQCKYMEDRVFPKEEVGAFLNPRFVSIKIDMEKGEGVALKEKYGVTAFPTFLVLDTAGALLYKFVGKYSPEDFITHVKRGLDPENSMLALDREYRSGKMKVHRLMEYIKIFQESFDYENAELLIADLEKKATLKDRISESYWAIFSHTLTNPVDLNKITFILDHETKLKRHIGETEINQYLTTAYRTILGNYIAGTDTEGYGKDELDIIRRQLQHKKDFDGREDFLLQADLAKALGNKEIDKVFELCEKNLPLLIKAGFIPYYKVFERLDAGNKKEMGRVFALGEQAFSMTTDAEEQRKLHTVFDRYKKLSCIGVYWENMTVDQAMDYLKYNKRWIFLNCYVPGNDACEYMNEQVFAREEIGDLLSPDFFSIKMDMEKAEATKMAEQYDINSYPTFLILNSDGLVYRAEGVLEAAEFIQMIRKIIASLE